MKTWDIRRWADKPEVTHKLELTCPVCGTDAQLEMGDTPGGILIAAKDLMLVFDPPGYQPPTNFLPDELRCRTCRKIFTSEDSDVR